MKVYSSYSETKNKGKLFLVFSFNKPNNQIVNPLIWFVSFVFVGFWGNIIINLI